MIRQEIAHTKLRPLIRWGQLAVAALAAGLCGAVVARSQFSVDGARQFTLIDDAMISLRYARNLAQGNGLVWNVGEPPVEGFTNLGYTLLMAPGFLFGDGLLSKYLPVMIVIVGFVATVWLTAELTWIVYPNSNTAPIAAGAMVALDFGFVFWTARGMEVSLVTAAVLAMTLHLFKWRETKSVCSLWIAATLGAIAVVIRLDSLAPVLTIGSWFVTCELITRRSGRSAFVVPGAAIATTLCILAFQAWYYADPLPNTYRLKVGGVSAGERMAVGWDVFVENAWPQMWPLLLLGPGLLLICSRSTIRSPNALLLLAIALVSVGYSVWVGGDYAEPQVHAPNRFILVGIPGLCVLAAAGAAAAAARLGRLVPSQIVAPLIGAIAVAVVVWPNYGHLSLLRSGEIPLLNYDEQRTALGLHLRAILPAGATIATHTAGQIPYYSELETVDLLGKSDRHIASVPQTADRFRPGHNKWDYRYGITNLAPDVIADEWGAVRSYLETHGGYERLPNGLWVRTVPSVPIDREALGQCYWRCAGKQ